MEVKARLFVKKIDHLEVSEMSLILDESNKTIWIIRKSNKKALAGIRVNHSDNKFETNLI